ncbi:TPA: hypothetical protein ACUJC4_004858, partial [Salmonella enterica]
TWTKSAINRPATLNTARQFNTDGVFFFSATNGRSGTSRDDHHSPYHAGARISGRGPTSPW